MFYKMIPNFNNFIYITFKIIKMYNISFLRI